MAKTTNSLNRVLGRFQARRDKPGDKKAGIDWEELHKKMSEDSAKSTWVDELPADELAETWARRASQMARNIEGEDQGEQVELAIIRLGREIYGVDVRYVYDIRPLVHLTRVPRTPSWVAGVVNLRGRIVSVLDLQSFLNLPAAENEGAQSPIRHLAVVETPEMELAILVDEVMAMESLPLHKIQEATTAVRGIRAEYVRGLVVREQLSDSLAETTNGHGISLAESANGQGSSNNAMLVILDLPALLADERLIIREELV